MAPRSRPPRPTSGTAWALQERMKELATLQEVLRILVPGLGDASGKERESLFRERLQRVVEILPSGWWSPERTRARIMLDGLGMSSRPEAPSPGDPMMEELLGPGSHAGVGGKLQIWMAGLPEERPEEADPFLPQEGELLRSVAEAVSGFLERELNRSRLGEALAFQRALLQALPLPMLVVDEQGRPLERNLEARELAADGSWIPGLVAELLSTLRSGGEVHDHLVDVPGEEGSPRTYQVRAALLPAAVPWAGSAPPKGQRIVLVVEDISLRRTTETRLRTLERAIEEAGDSVVVADGDGRMVYANPAWELETGFDRKEVMGRSIRDFRHRVVDETPEEMERTREVMAQLLRGEPWSGVAMMRRKDGSRYPKQITAAPVRNLDGQLEGLISIGRDVSREEELRERLEASRRLETVGQLAGGIAHDFNNLLQVIGAHASLIPAELIPGEEARESLEEVLRAVERGGALTRHLLAFSRGGQPDPQPVRPADLLREFRPALGRLMGSDIQVDLEEPLDRGAILADAGDLEHILLNLVLNARDAMPEGGDVSIRLERRTGGEGDGGGTREPPGELELVLRDTGTGIRPEHLERIWEPFFTTKPRGEGTGLGLSTVRQIVEGYEGRIALASHPGEGTEVRIRFPLTDRSPVSASAESMEDVEPGVSMILLLEDDPALAPALVRALELKGANVELVTRAREAIRWLEEGGNPDLILLDLVSPGGGAGAVLEHRERLFGDIPVVLMSGLPLEEIRRRYGDRTNLPVLAKPFTLGEFLRAVRDAAGGGS